MALEFARVHVIGRQAGHSAVKAAAYRSGEKLFDEHLGQSANYSHRSDEVLHSEILLPEGGDERLLDRATLWNAIEDREDEHNRRASAQLAKDHIIALPKELAHEQHVELIRDFAKAEFLEKGLVVDLNIHGHSEGNPHAHLMVTTRTLEGKRFGLKCREINGGFYGGRKVPDAEMLKVRWADFQEAYFKKNEIDLGVTRNNGEYPAELHLGQAHGMDKDGKDSVFKTENDKRIVAREAAIVADPSIIINRVASRKSVFSVHDLTREASNSVRDSEMFSALKTKLVEHACLVRLSPENSKKVFFTTQSVIDTEMNIRGQGEQLSRPDARFSGLDAESVLSKNEFLSEEQREVVRRISSDKRLASVVGLAGAGKSTTLGVARSVFESHGHTVRGIALAGKAAEELEKASGIASSTIHSWLYAVEDGREAIQSGDVLVMDEAGMVDNALMERVITQVNQSGAKLVLVGDTEQLQPIQAGRPMRDLNHAVPLEYTELSTIRRQHAPWQREATLALAQGDGDAALKDYAAHGCVHAQETQDDAMEQLVGDYLHDMAGDGAGRTHAVLAHSNAAVDAMNEQIRAGLIEHGRLRESRVLELQTKDSDGEITKRSMDIGLWDRILFTKNDTGIGVKNGTLGEVVSIKGNTLSVQTDEGKAVSVDLRDYAHIKHGYAMTIHKSQGITVDRTSVLATPTLNKHLGYVAMSRHRGEANLYYGRDDFASVEKLANRFVQVERAESVADFAQRHRVEFEIEKAVVNDVPTIPIEVAKKTLEDARQAGIARLTTAAQVSINVAIKVEQDAKENLTAHINQEPRTGFLSNKSAHAVWEKKLEAIQKTLFEKRHTVSRLKTTLASSEERFSREARRAAAQQYPDAVNVVQSFKSQEKADGFVEDIERIQKDIAELADRPRKGQQLDRLHRSLNRAINDLAADEKATAKLTPAQVSSIKEAGVKLALGKQTRALEPRSRGGLEH